MLSSENRQALRDAIATLEEAETASETSAVDAVEIAGCLGFAQAKIGTAMQLLKRIEAWEDNL